MAVPSATFTSGLRSACIWPSPWAWLLLLFASSCVCITAACHDQVLNYEGKSPIKIRWFLWDHLSATPTSRKCFWQQCKRCGEDLWQKNTPRLKMSKSTPQILVWVCSCRFFSCTDEQWDDMGWELSVEEGWVGTEDLGTTAGPGNPKSCPGGSSSEELSLLWLQSLGRTSSRLSAGISVLTHTWAEPQFYYPNNCGGSLQNTGENEVSKDTTGFPSFGKSIFPSQDPEPKVGIVILKLSMSKEQWQEQQHALL